MTQSNLTKRKFNKPAGRLNRTAAAMLKVVLPVAIVVMGILIAIAFVKLRRPPRRKEHKTMPPLVKVQQLHTQDIQMVVRGYGTVSPKAQVDLVPEVSGKVVSINPAFKAGGFIPAGQQILQIDPRDYELAVQQARAAVADAQLRLTISMAEADLARRDWDGGSRPGGVHGVSLRLQRTGSHLRSVRGDLRGALYDELHARRGADAGHAGRVGQACPCVLR